jgi:hypothetical protein
MVVNAVGVRGKNDCWRGPAQPAFVRECTPIYKPTTIDSKEGSTSKHVKVRKEQEYSHSFQRGPKPRTKATSNLLDWIGSQLIENLQLRPLLVKWQLASK